MVGLQRPRGGQRTQRGGVRKTGKVGASDKSGSWVDVGGGGLGATILVVPQEEREAIRRKRGKHRNRKAGRREAFGVWGGMVFA